MSVEERLTHLEPENRRLKIAGLLILLTAASVLMMGQVRPPSEIAAQRFTLLNGDGLRIAELRPDGSGLPYLALYEPGGTNAVISMGLSTTDAIEDQPKHVAGPYLDVRTAPSSSTSSASISLSVVNTWTHSSG